MGKKLILIVFLALVVFSAIYALWDKREYTTSSDRAYQAFMDGESYRIKLYYRDALPEYEKAVKLDSSFAMAYCRIADLQNGFGDSILARQNIEKAMSLFPKITKREQLLIQITNTNLGKDEYAWNNYVEEYGKLYPDDLMTHVFQAAHYMGLREYDKAITEYQKIIDKEPGYALAYNMLGYLNYYARNYDEALSSIKKYSIIAGQQANPHDSYGEILMYLGRYDEAIKEFETANKIKPDLDFVLDHLARVNREIGRYRDAIGYFERAKEFARNEAFAARAEEQIAYTMYLRGESQQALDILNNLYSEHPEWYSIPTYRGVVAADMGKYDIAQECVDYLTKLIEEADSTKISAAGKNDMVISREALLGKIALAKGDYDDAIGNYKTTIELSGLPSVIMWKFLLGRSYLQAGKLDQAEQVLSENLNDNPMHPYTLLELARVYNQKGDTDDEKQMLLTYLSVMSGADDGLADVTEARQMLDAFKPL